MQKPAEIVATHDDKDVTKHGTSTDIFYAINKNTQYFHFPHTNCDEYSNNELCDIYFNSGFGAYCRRIIASISGYICDLNTLEHNSQFVNYVVAWMRLKFIAEQVDPIRYTRYFESQPIPPNKTPKLPPELFNVYKADTTELYSFVDTLANRVQIAWINIMMGLDACTDAELENTCMRINSELQTIRESECGEYIWKHVNPYELTIYPFLQFQFNLRRVLRFL
jgi:hypothetical protein